MFKNAVPAFALFVLSPLTAEYILRYDVTTGNLTQLLLGLLLLAPLYGGPALLIRELARRTDRGWPTIILLAFAFGIFQAGLVDHSLFNPDYRAIDYWQDLRNPTLIPLLGVSAYLSVSFVLGHVIWSISVPVALIECFVPQRRTTPWLGSVGLVVTAILYLLASALIFYGHVSEEQFLPSAAQLIVSALLVGACSVAAFAIRIPQRPPIEQDPSPRRVLVAALFTLGLPTLLEVLLGWAGASTAVTVGWWNVTLRVMLIAVLALLTIRWSRTRAWSPRHTLALAAGALLTQTWIAYTVEPIGEVSSVAKVAHSIAFTIGVVVLLVLAERTLRGRAEPDSPTSSLA
jgi:hypothetical protein